jgi:itaconyl-CoA hydratase
VGQQRGEPGVFDAGEFPLAAVGGRPFEGFSVGQTFEHHWGRTFVAADNVIFSTATCTWNPLYLNSEYARSQGHPDVVVNPMLVLCMVCGLSVEDLSERGGAMLGLDECRFHTPVYPGDTIRAQSRVVSCRDSGSDPRMGIVSWHTTAFNQRGVLVVDYRRANFIPKELSA